MLLALCLIVILHVYAGYLVVLLGAGLFLRSKNSGGGSDETLNRPCVTVLITAFNEEDNIRRRIDNVLETCAGADDLLDLLVVSDGSTDSTDAIVSSHDDPRVRLYRPEGSDGKTDAQNKSMDQAYGEIIILTDAGTRFESGFLENILAAFDDPSVGCAVGHLNFERQRSNSLSANQGYYWRYEQSLRQAESKLGILAVSSGVCLAFRKSLFRPMVTSVGDDCVIPLDIVTQGHRVVYVPDAVAWDRMPADTRSEFKTRVRMTLRNWQGTWLYPELLNPFKHPGYAFALWSHKLLRWLSPLFLIAATVIAVGKMDDGGHYQLIAFLFGGFYLAGILGWAANRAGIAVPLVGTVYSFLLANAGFLTGIIRATLLKDRITAYKAPQE